MVSRLASRSTRSSPTLFAAAAHAVITAVLLSLGGCAWLDRMLGWQAFDAPPFPAFARYPSSAPVVSSGRPGFPIMAFDPNVYVDDEGYHLFYTSIFCRQAYEYSFSWDPGDPDACNIVASVGSIAYAFSSDRGLTWVYRKSPVVLPARAGFDSSKIETAHVFRLGDTLYLAYSADGDRNGEDFSSRYQIGVARLVLGPESVREVLMDESRHFQRRATPLLSADLRPGRFDNNVQEPSIVIRPDSIELYYVGLGLAMSEAPINAPGQRLLSVGLGRAILDRDLNVVTRSPSAIAPWANIAEVKYFNGSYHLFATSHSEGEFHADTAITYSRSTDGTAWSPPQVILSNDSSTRFDNWGLMAPTVAISAREVIMFYTAYEARPHKCFPIAPSGRFGKPVAGDTKCLFATVGRAVSFRGKQGGETRSTDRTEPPD